MKNSMIFSLLVLFTFSTPWLSYAECETQKFELEQFQSACDNAIAASATTSIVGSIFIPIVGGLLGAGPGLVAQNQCRIKDEKKQALDQCIQAVRAAQIRQQQELQARANKVREINFEFDRQRVELGQRYQILLDAAYQKIQDEGYDPEEPSIALELAQNRAQLEQEYNSELAQIEQERQRSLSRI